MREVCIPKSSPVTCCHFTAVNSFKQCHGVCVCQILLGIILVKAKAKGLLPTFTHSFSDMKWGTGTAMVAIKTEAL